MVRMTGAVGERSLMKLSRFWKQFTHIEDAFALAQAIVDTVREPLLVFDKDLRVIAASRSFIRSSRSAPRTPKGGCFTSWATANGIFQSFDCCWKES
jgi:hypothetical protein